MPVLYERRGPVDFYYETDYIFSYTAAPCETIVGIYESTMRDETKPNIYFTRYQIKYSVKLNNTHVTEIDNCIFFNIKPQCHSQISNTDRTYVTNDDKKYYNNDVSNGCTALTVKLKTELELAYKALDISRNEDDLSIHYFLKDRSI